MPQIGDTLPQILPQVHTLRVPALTNKSIRAAIAEVAKRGKPLDLHDPSGLVARVAVTGNVTFVVRYKSADGGRRRLKLGRFGDLTVDQAKKLAREKLGEAAKGHDPQAAKRKAREERAAAATLEAVVAAYVEDAGAAWKPSTRRVYTSSLSSFTAWAKSARVRTVHDLDARALASYRGHAIRKGRRKKAAGGTRKDVVELDERRSPAAVNVELRAVKSALTYMRRLGMLPAIKVQDEIADALRLVPVERDQPDPLQPDELRRLLAAAVAHDRDAHAIGVRPVAPLVAVVLIAGLRLGEALRLCWADLRARDGLLRVVAGKTKRERLVDLSVSPGLAELLAAMRAYQSDDARIFADHTEDTATAARRRIIDHLDAPPFQWSQRHSRVGERSAPTLRSTCGSYLANAPGIFGAASVYRTAAQLGHSVQVAERHYLGVLRAIDPAARTLEAAMGIEAELAEVIAQAAE